MIQNKWYCMLKVHAKIMEYLGGMLKLFLSHVFVQLVLKRTNKRLQGATAFVMKSYLYLKPVSYTHLTLPTNREV